MKIVESVVEKVPDLDGLLPESCPVRLLHWCIQVRFGENHPKLRHLSTLYMTAASGWATTHEEATQALSLARPNVFMLERHEATIVDHLLSLVLSPIPSSVELDSNGYPTERFLERLAVMSCEETMEFFEGGHFESIARQLPYATVTREQVHDDLHDDPDGFVEIRFSTGGWSGNESFMSQLEQLVMVRARYLERKDRGGGWVFRLSGTASSPSSSPSAPEQEQAPPAARKGQLAGGEELL